MEGPPNLRTARHQRDQAGPRRAPPQPGQRGGGDRTARPTAAPTALLAVPGHRTSAGRRQTVHLPERRPSQQRFLNALSHMRAVTYTGPGATLRLRGSATACPKTSRRYQFKWLQGH